MIYFKQVCLVAVVVLVIILAVYNIEDWSAISTSLHLF